MAAMPNTATLRRFDVEREAKPRPLDEQTRARVSATIKRVVKRHPKLARLLAK